MNKLHILIVSLLTALGLTTSSFSMGNYYPRAFIVEELDYARDMVIVSDAVGMEWEFDGIEDWEISDVVVAIMYDNGTKTIYDDSFVDTRYSGYTLPIE